jgi:predicted RNA-binding Zn ribbon-like protein
VGIAQADPSAWRDGDWLNAYEEARRFIYEGQAQGAEDQAMGSPARSVERLRTQLTPALADLRRFLEDVDRARTTSNDAAPFGAGKTPSVRFAGDCLYLLDRRGMARVAYAPSGRDPGKRLSTQMRLRAGDLLTRVDLRRLKRCPECGRLFLSTRRQRFDTAQCSLRDRVRRFRSKSKSAKKRR